MEQKLYDEFDMLELNSEEIIAPKIINNELNSLLILANLLDYTIEYDRKIYSVNNIKFFIINIFVLNTIKLRLKLKLVYDDNLNKNKISNICFVDFPDYTARYNNISNTYEITDKNIISAINEFKTKL